MMIALYNGTRVLYRKSLKVCDDLYPPSSWLYPKPNYTLCVDKLFPRMLNLLLIFAYIISSFISKLNHIKQGFRKRKLLFSPLEGGGAMNHSLIIDHSNCLANIYHHRRHNHHYCCLLYSFRCHQHHHCHRNNCSITINHSNSLIYDVKDVIKEGQG